MVITMYNYENDFNALSGKALDEKSFPILQIGHDNFFNIKTYLALARLILIKTNLIREELGLILVNYTKKLTLKKNDNGVVIEGFSPEIYKELQKNKSNESINIGTCTITLSYFIAMTYYVLTNFNPVEENEINQFIIDLKNI